MFAHEVHRVAGAKEDEFDSAFREVWMPALGDSDEARLLWYLRLAHGSGAAYTVVTVTGIKDAAAWQALAERVRVGDLQKWSAEVDSMRHGSDAKVLVPVPWSPLQDLDLTSVPTTGEEHDPTMYMEDTAWPYPGGLEAYLQAAGSLYEQTLSRSKQAGHAILDMEAAFQPAYGTHHGTEVILWQKIVDHSALLHLLTHDTPPSYKVPGTWMNDALKVRDRWESRLLRTVSWSPCC
ncbi:MAG TPA: hypothetical protein VEJ87_15055 [Acidimicrobiales bacterium]|nr:hypothetical protein [Acidimicrobiales bacterium]